MKTTNTYKVQDFNIWYDRSSKLWLLAKVDNNGEIVNFSNGQRGYCFDRKEQAFAYVAKQSA